MNADDSISFGSVLLKLFLGALIALVGVLVSFSIAVRGQGYYAPHIKPEQFFGKEETFWKVTRSNLFNPKSNPDLFFSTHLLNDWSKNTFKDQLRPSSGGMFEIAPRAPLFYIAKSQLSILIPLDVSILGMGPDEPIWLQMEGAFARMGERSIYTYVPRIHFLGKAPIPNILGFRTYLYSRVWRVFKNTQEYRELAPAWDKLRAVEVIADRLILTKPNP